MKEDLDGSASGLPDASRPEECEAFHCELCGKPGEDVSERDFMGLDGETYQLYAHPGCSESPKPNFDFGSTPKSNGWPEGT